MGRVTISTHNGSSVARDHNIRNKKVVSKEKHIDPNGHYEVWVDEPARKAYDRLFGEAVARYNANQSRPERRIKSYYNNICKDKKKNPVYEMIIGIYGKDENDNPICSKDQGKEIMRTFVETWKERNPNLELIGAYYHADEPNAEPHVHIDYIPVAHGYTRGLETQTGLVKALSEQGFEKVGKHTAQIQWEKQENDYLTKLCSSRGLVVEHPCIKNREHLETAALKAQTALRSVSKARNELKAIETRLNELEPLQAEYEAKKAYIKHCDEVSSASVMYPIEAKITEKGLIHKQKFVTVPAEIWEAKHVSFNEKEILRLSTKIFEDKIENAKSKASKASSENLQVLKGKIDKLESVNSRLMTENFQLRQKIKNELIVPEKIKNALLKMPKEDANRFLKALKSEGIVIFNKNIMKKL